MDQASGEVAVRLEACVRGRVQGVGYRAFVRAAARRLRLRGLVWNGDDGAVYVLAEGPRPALEALVAELGTGPRMSGPAGVATRWCPAQGDLPAWFEVGG